MLWFTKCNDKLDFSNIHNFPAWRSAKKQKYAIQASKLTC